METPVQAPSLDSPSPIPAAPAVDVSSPSDAPVTALKEAVTKGDTRTYKQERHKQRLEQSPSTPGSAPVPVKQATSTDVTPKPAASEPAAREKGQKLKQRSAELDADIADLNQKLRIRAELDKRLKATEPTAPKPSPAPAEAGSAAKGWQRYKHLPNAPKIDDFESHDDYMDARIDFVADQKLQEQRTALETQSREQGQWTERTKALDEDVQQFATRVKTWQTSNPGESISPQLLEIHPLSALEFVNASLPPDDRIAPGPHHYVVEQIFRSETPGPIGAYFTKQPQEFQRLCHLALTRNGDHAVVREIGRLEAKFLAAPASPAPSPGARISTVAPPPTTLGRKPGSPTDPLKHAVEAGDTRAYKALRRSQRLAAL